MRAHPVAGRAARAVTTLVAAGLLLAATTAPNAVAARTPTSTTTTAPNALTATGSQNPNLTVTLTVSPKTATTGTVVTLTSKVKNNSSSSKTVTFKYNLVDPNGGTREFTLGTSTINAGKTASNTYSYTVLATAVRGNHLLTSSATQGSCASACTSSATVTLPIS